ncbi:MAG: hypothetical protein H8E14_13570 [Candidatus Marinimicrobia bacterium]|nr:hypothetical protein [Candidatus Neomarinimicrobiota bacterium]
MRNHKKLIIQFLEKAKSQGFMVEPVTILRTNTFALNNCNILVRTASDLGKRYFFGLNYINAEEIYNLANSFVAFICGDVEKTVFLPTDILVRHLPQISHDRNGEYKINFTRDLELVLSGRGNRLDCSEFTNNWNLLSNPPGSKNKPHSAEQSIHSVIQGRLIEIGNIRGYQTYSPDKSKLFNRKQLKEITTLKECPTLQYSDYKSLRNIDVIWFREVSKGFYPDYAFEVEITTGVWSGFGRLASLRDYSTKMCIITNEDKRFKQVSSSFPELQGRYTHLIPDNIGLLYSAEKNLIELRKEINL